MSSSLRFRDVLLGTASSALVFAVQTAAQSPPCQGSSGAQFAECCHSAWKSWSIASSSAVAPTSSVVDYTTSTIYVTDTNVPTTTLCDGFVRYMESLPVTTSVSTWTPTPAESYTLWADPVTFTEPKPTCSISETDCTPLREAFQSSSSAWEADPTLPEPTAYLPCESKAYLACPTADYPDGQVCKLYGGDMTLYYWPVTTTGDFCAPTRTTVFNPPPPTKSTVIDGRTFVSPSVYVRVAEASAKRHMGQYRATSCGPTRSDIWLTFSDATQLSTRRYKPGTRTNTRTFDLADLNTPAPASIYNRGRSTSCETPSACPTLALEDAYALLDVPPALQEVDLEWKYCTPRSEGFFGTEVYIPLETNAPNWPAPAVPQITPP